MSRPVDVFAERYAAALTEFLTVSDETRLERAYELGREAILQGLGVLDLAAVHTRAFGRGVPPSSPTSPAPTPEVPHRTWQFFAEALGPFEMALRGFREANRALKEAASTLEDRVAARTRELQAAERALREQSLLLRSVVDSISDGIAVADTSGKYLLFNRAGEQIAGQSATSEPPQRWAEAYGVFRDDTVTPFPSGELPLARAIRGEQTEAVALFVRNAGRPEGAHLSVVGSPLRTEEGEVVGGVSVFRDVTDAKRAEDERRSIEERYQQTLRKTEEQLRQSQKMDAIGRLAGGVAHDFNNVLSVILSYSQMMLMDLAPGAPMRDDVDEISKAAQRAASLTRQLLAFSRQQVMEPKVLDLNDLIIGMDKMLKRLLGADVDLVSLPGSALGRVRADPGAIEQVIMNLAVNARDAMPTGGKLTIETGNVMLDEGFAREHPGVTAGPHVMLAVTDSGCGMDAATKSRIFEPFFTTKEKGKGTGLGLSMVFGIVKQSGGTVWVYSELGRGTTFKVYLPRIDAAADSLRPELLPESVGGRETILLVDDDDQVRAVTRAILQRSGYQVIDARDAGDALEHASRHAGNIDLLLTDVVMPKMSGPELAKRVAEVRPGTKLLCMSGYTDDSVVRHGVLEGHVAYLQKPITPEALVIRVRQVLESRKET
jgi:two-component system, cell cycle sensor histidine kinase and response regulator CckA